MSKDEQLNPDGLAALRARFEQQSRKAQAYYTAMHAVRAVLGGDDAAGAWMEAPLAAFEGRTPAQLVNEGRVDELLAHVRTLKA
ncbi:MbcA/ParS/Xre antitoxin family protein [Massilia sp. 2TAF26]|uniref:MbcA/ParS/Xre antitoxin family protein n=1 Tax=Massilia sp. 2TAF26 TaxID=3233012 RepID=UPI003F992471